MLTLLILFNVINIYHRKGRDINSSIHLFNYEEKMLKFSKLLALFFVVRLSHSQTSKCQNKPGDAAADWAIVYKAPGQNRGKIIFATGAGTWDDGAQPLSNVNQHSFAKALEHVVADNNNIKFIAYNNVPPSVPSVKTKSNSKGVIILSTAANSAAWIVHTVPGFPTARTPYSWPVAENARGHLLICLTISKSQINAIGSQRHIRLIKSPAAINGHNTNLEADITNWAVSDPGNIFCHIDKPYLVSLKIKPENQRWQFALTTLIYLLDLMQSLLNLKIVRNKCSFSQIYHILKHQNVRIKLALVTAIVYKAPAQLNGKIIFATAAGAWDNGEQPFTNERGHSFAKAIEHIVGNNADIKFLAYNNVPPGIPNLKTKSNSKGIIILSIAAATDSAAWIVHTVPGFPAAKTGYSWPVAENARGHLLICLTISESQINAIAASLLLVQPVIYYNDIPQTETAGMPYFNKLAEGKISTLPPFTSRQTIRTQNANPVTVHIYSKSESSKYEIYKKVIAKVLKKTIKVWSRRDSKLKGDCRGSQRHIRLIKSPAAINDHNTNLEADITNWAVSDPGNIFCHIDKPYMKNQTREPAMAICIDNINIFARFDAIAAQLEDCPK
ncbi:Deoxyribonuclease-2-alpha [Trichinella sp. T6]|nr:Deoxyribonuclease-2-alpha [Trichinella sp. T6]